MEIKPRKNGKQSFREKVYIEGKAVSKTFSRRSDAIAWKRRIKIEEDRRKALGLDRMEKTLFKDFVPRWKKQQEPLLAESSIRGYFSMLDRHILPFYENKLLSEITKSSALRFVEKLRDNGVSGSGIDRIIALLKGVLNDALDLELISFNPLTRFPKQTKKMNRDKFWSMDEVKNFLSSCQSSPYYPLFAIALNTGMRRGELCGLKWDRVDFEKNTIEVSRIRDRYGLRETTKTKKPRCIYMNQETRRIVTHLRKQNYSEFVFVDRRGLPIDVQHVYRAFNEAQERAGMKHRLRFHDLRHTYASHYVMESGGNIFALKEMLGHSDISMTMRYSHIAKEHLAKESERVSFSPNEEFSPKIARKEELA